jgi:hypothetical protein
MYKAQYAFNVSMIMCPAVHMATRSLLRSSSTHEPSDPLSRVKILYNFILHFHTLYDINGFTRLSTPRWAFHVSVGGIVGYLGVAL